MHFFAVLCIEQVQGSHKSNIDTPGSMDDYTRLVTEVNTKKGDCVIFCEACIHGALPWRGEHDRRMVLYR